LFNIIKTHICVIKKSVGKLTLFFFVVGISFNVYAGEESGFVSYAPGKGINIESLELSIKPETTLVLQGTPDPNKDGYSGGQFGVSWVGYLDITKKFGDFGFAYLQFKSGLGDTVEDSLDLLSGVNFNSYDVGGNIRLRRYYYVQHLFGKQLNILIGRENPRDVLDQVKYANDDDIQFLSNIFNKSPAMDWPSDYTFTIHAAIMPDAIDFLEFEFNFLEGDADWQRIFEGGIYTWQLNFKPNKLFNLDTKKWEGNYRFYTWLNTRNHIKLVDESSAPSTDIKEFNYGIGTGFDQAIDEVFGLFGRLGWQRPDVLPADGGANIELSWSAGIQANGRHWKRENDILAFAVGQDFPSKEYDDAGNDGANEGHFETYYSFAITDYIHAGPDIQLIRRKDTNVFIYGCRLHVTF